MSLATKVVRVIEEGRTLERTLTALFPRTIASLKRPTMGNFLEAAASFTPSTDELLDTLLGQDWRMCGYQDEFAKLTQELQRRYETLNGRFPEGHIEGASSFVLYVWTRHRKPISILETGVNNGHSTAVFLNALLKNGRGELHSTDIWPDVGPLVAPHERKAWHYHPLKAGSAKQEFRDLVARLGQIDLFFHDSMHSYNWQTFEYHAVFHRVSGLFASDDVDGNFAFLNFASFIKQKPRILLDANKLSGFISCTPTLR